MNRRLILALAAAWLLVLPGMARAQDSIARALAKPPTLYPIDPKTEPLLSSIKRLKLFAKGEETHILRYNPARPDTPVARLDSEGKTERLDKMPGTQVRLAYAISAAIGEEERLDAKAKKQLATALARYKIHTYDETGRITGSRLPKNEDEALRQVNSDVEGAHHLRKLGDDARKQLGN